MGVYIWALSLTTIFSVGIDLGLSPLLIREAARDVGKSERLLRSVIGLKLIFALGTLIALFVLLALRPPDQITFIVVAVACLVMLFDSFSMTFYSILRARQNVNFESFGTLAVNLLVFATGLYLLGIARSPIMAIVALATGSGLNCLFSWSVVHFKFHLRTRPQFDREAAVSLLRLVAAFAMAGIFVRIYNAADSVLLGYFSGSAAVGLYSVPAKVVTALQALIPGAIIASIYPAMSHYYVNSRVMLERIFERSVGYLLMLALPITGGLLVLIPTLLRTIWPAYASAASTFFLMAIGIPFLFLTFPSGYLLNACNRQRKNTINRAVITFVNIVLNLLLIPYWGIVGAGIAFLAANVLLFILDFSAARDIIPFEWCWVAKLGLKAATATLVMVAVIFLSQSAVFQLVAKVSLGRAWALLGLLAIGGAVYVAVLAALRVFTREELAMMRNLIRRESEPTVIPPAL